ncbi:MAG: T9SS type A sorting domain-containing protein, partial [Sphingobacteriales bacterium]
MKKILLLCLITVAYILSPKNASAQYKSIFGKNATSWSVVQCYNYVDGGDVSDSFYIDGDTLIGNNTYRKIIRTDFFKVKTYSESFIREDTANGKVWMKFKTRFDSSERIVMNLNLLVGDSFPVFDYDGSIRKYITADSVYYENGLKHIRFNAFTECRGTYRVSQKITFIEGIGSNAGYENTNGQSNLLCYFKDSEKVFTSEYFNGTCRIYIVGIEENNRSFNNIKLYPNPNNGSGVIVFDNPEISCVTLEIYDANGKQVYINSSKNTYISFEINASGNGIY